MLSWESSYEIVQALMAAHPDADLDAIGMDALYRLILALPDFADDPLLVNDGILKDILREWYEESGQEWT
jgi:FeS assembly protein IscX